MLSKVKTEFHPTCSIASTSLTLISLVCLFHIPHYLNQSTPNMWSSLPLCLHITCQLLPSSSSVFLCCFWQCCHSICLLAIYQKLGTDAAFSRSGSSTKNLGLKYAWVLRAEPSCLVQQPCLSCNELRDLPLCPASF